VTTQRDIRSFVPITRIAKRAALDMYADYEKEQARYMAWAIDFLKKLVRETLKSPKKYAFLTVNKHLNNAVLPCDFKEEIGVYVIDNCGKKVQLVSNQHIINSQLATDIGCESECKEKCGCYPKQLCDELQTTQVVKKIRIGEVDYDETVTSTLMPNGEYYVVTTTPVLNTVEGEIEYINKKEYITSFDLNTCGCIKPTEQNSARLEAVCYDAWCCYCAPCSTSSEVGGYRIFEESGTIHVDGGFAGDKIYLEYRGFLPKSGNEYLAPEVAFETIIEHTKYKSIQNKKGVPQWERRDQFDSYLRERSNMTKVMGRISIADILDSALKIPKFQYNYNACGGAGSYIPVSTTTIVAAPSGSAVTNITVVDQSGNGNCNPSIITINGLELQGGTTYVNPVLADAISYRIFANPFNRFLTSSEVTINPAGGFTILTGNYAEVDEFDIIPKWCVGSGDSSTPTPTPTPEPTETIYNFNLTENTVIPDIAHTSTTVLLTIYIRPNGFDYTWDSGYVDGDNLVFEPDANGVNTLQQYKFQYSSFLGKLILVNKVINIAIV
jgi:hypothetical protein